MQTQTVSVKVTTAQVAATWPQLASERIVQMHTSLGSAAMIGLMFCVDVNALVPGSCQEMMLKLQSAVNVSPVEIVGRALKSRQLHLP